MARLTLVPTPIGNLEDITLRALRTLREADLVLAEDTRHTAKLLRHYEIDARVTALHQHNEHKRAPQLAAYILENDLNAAAVTDAGTPGISDPGFLLAREALARELPLEVLPGPTAFVPALVASGLPCDRFVFEGFLPHKKGRQTRLINLAEEPRTMVFYESPYRLLKLLDNFIEHFGPERRASISRELTKIHEETTRGAVAELRAYYAAKDTIKGECVVVLAGAP